MTAVDEAMRGGERNFAVVVLTYNEERNLSGCLESVAPLGARVFVIDSGSTDGTVEISRRCGATLLQHPFTTHADQWAWAIGQLPTSCEWILGLDADQRLTAEACRSVMRFVGDPGPAKGAYLCRRQLFRGRWIRHGGYYPKYLLKLFSRSAVRLDRRDLVDHHFAVTGPAIRLAGDLIEANANEDEIRTWIDKHNRYAVLQAADEIRRRRRVQWRLAIGSPDDRVAFLKAVWQRMPLFFRSWLYFMYRYVVRLGFLDGKEGFLFHFLQGFWYRLIVDVNISEMRLKSDRERKDAAELQFRRGE